MIITERLFLKFQIAHGSVLRAAISSKSGRHIREAIWITKTDNMNRDEGSYHLSHEWDKLLHTDDRY